MPTRDIYSHTVNTEAKRFSEIINNELEGTLSSLITDINSEVTPQ
jgi:hypothetical protein